MAEDMVRNLLIERRNRLVASLMNHFERQVAPTLPTAARAQLQKEYRERVMSAVGEHHDVVLDILKASSTGEVTVNEEALRLLQRIHAVVVRK